MNNAFEEAFQNIFNAPKSKDRMEGDQNRNTPLLPSEADEPASTVDSEQPQGERHE